MPLQGTLDLAAALVDAPVVDGFAPASWSLPDVELLQVSFEVDAEAALAVTPPALHPSIPTYATFSVWRHPTSPAGPFTLAMVRLIVRAGVRPRGLLLGSWCDNPEAAAALRAGWGYRIEPAVVSLLRRYGQHRGTVAVDGVTALDLALVDPEPVPGTDLELFDNLHLVNVAGGDPVIVQVDPLVQPTDADRGRPRLTTFDADRLGVGGIVPVHPIVAVGCRASIELAPPRFVMDPVELAIRGTRRL